MQGQKLFNVWARSSLLPALGIRGEETLWSFGAQLHGNVQPRLSEAEPVPIVPAVQPLRSVQNVRSRWGQSKIQDIEGLRTIGLIAGRTAQEYNQRKGRQGAFWEDRYHATAIEADEHLHRCLIYIDLNMVRTGVVNHPGEWAHGGYREIQEPAKRYGIIDLPGLGQICR